jgi:hypothetical protein
MGVFHRATITPTKAEVLAQWSPTQPWGPDSEAEVEVVGAFRFDDPDNQTGIETHLISAGGVLYQVPLTYRNEPLAGAEDAFVCEVVHSELGTRYVYDGLGDPRYLLMLAAVAMTGQGEALGMVYFDGSWRIAPANVRIHGGGWGLERVPVDPWERESSDQDRVVFTNQQFELTFVRQPKPASRPSMGLAATWDGQVEPVLLATVTER